MRKFPLISILTLLLCTISVYAAPSFKIIEDSVNLTGTHGQTLSSGFLVNNTGTEDLAIGFTGYTLASGANQLSVSGLSNISNIESGSIIAVSFSIVMPNKQKPGLYAGTLTATSNASNTDQITINANVTPSYSVSTNPASKMSLGSIIHNSTHTKTFDITNTGNDDLTQVVFDFSKIDFNLKTNKSNFTLPVGTTETIKFNITIPENTPTGNVTLGNLKLSSTELNVNLFGLEAEVGGGLEIQGLDIFIINRKSESGSDLDVLDGQKLNFGDKNIGPETEMRFNFDIENTFTDDEAIDINDITVRVTIEEIDDGSDFEEESEQFNLEPQESRDLDITINIPLSVDAGSYDIAIEVKGQDDRGIDHTAQMNLKMDVDKESREVIISEASLFPEKIKCSGELTLTATIKNLGSKIEENAKLEIINTDLSINSVNSNLGLTDAPFDGDDEFTKKLIINVDKDTKEGTYPINIKSYIQEGILWETKTVNLVVEACSQDQEETKIEEKEPEAKEEITETEAVGTGVEEAKETISGEEIPVLEPITTTEVSLAKRPVFWLIAAFLNVLIIVVIALLVVKLVWKEE